VVLFSESKTDLKMTLSRLILMDSSILVNQIGYCASPHTEGMMQFVIMYMIRLLNKWQAGCSKSKYKVQSNYRTNECECL